MWFSPGLALSKFNGCRVAPRANTGWLLTDSCAKQFSVEQRRCSPGARRACVLSAAAMALRANHPERTQRLRLSPCRPVLESGLALAFNRDEVSALLVKVHRRCSICHRFCGVKIETDHILPASEGGSDEIDNAIPVCFECHAEIHSYNPQHPRGRKFLPEELRGHKSQWLEVCEKHPELLITATRTADVGPLQALVDELEFNMVVSRYGPAQMGALFSEEQFRRAIAHGAVATLEPGLKQAILEAYAAMSRSNQRVLSAINTDGAAWLTNMARDEALIGEVAANVEAAHQRLLAFLSSDGR
jgi:5-methylcytosine-specific restriction endonuclease McrA